MKIINIITIIVVIITFYAMIIPYEYERVPNLGHNYTNTEALTALNSYRKGVKGSENWFDKEGYRLQQKMTPIKIIGMFGILYLIFYLMLICMRYEGE